METSLFRKDIPFSAFLLFAALAVVPLFTDSFYIWQVVAMASLYAVWAMSWDIFSGYLGQISFGHAFFIGTGGFIAAILNKNLGLDPWITIISGAFIAGAMGIVVGALTLRLKGPYFAMITLALNLLVSQLALILWRWTGGEEGVPGLDPLTASPLKDYYAALILAFICFSGFLLLVKSRYGYIFISIRENQDAAEASGVNSTLYKVLVFGLSGFIAGVAGGFHVHIQMHASYGLLQVLMSAMVIIMCLLGGIGSITGPLFGAYGVYLLMETLRGFAEYRMLVFTLILFFTIFYMPDGIFFTVRRLVLRLIGWFFAWGGKRTD